MKIALIRQRYNAYGGAERFIERALLALDDHQHLTIDLIARSWQSAQLKGRVIACNPFYIGRTWRDWSFARHACRLVSKSGYDLVQSHERVACCDIYRAGDGVHAQWLENRARALGAASRWFQDLAPWHRYTLAAERRLFASPRLKAVICNSRMVAQEIQRHFQIDAGRIHVIYNGVALDQFYPQPEYRAELRHALGVPDESLLFLFVGSGFQRKGVPVLLEAFARMSRTATRPVFLAVVGADRRAAVVQARAAALGISDRVFLPGPQAGIHKWYAAADCFVLPTLYDPFPNAVLEALACGLPVITSSQCGAAEILEDGRTGWSCDALNVKRLTEIMSALDPKRCREMGAQARHLAERFPIADMAGRMTELYRQVLASP